MKFYKLQLFIFNKLHKLLFMRSTFFEKKVVWLQPFHSNTSFLLTICQSAQNILIKSNI